MVGNNDHIVDSKWLSKTYPLRNGKHFSMLINYLRNYSKTKIQSIIKLQMILTVKNKATIPSIPIYYHVLSILSSLSFSNDICLNNRLFLYKNEFILIEIQPTTVDLFHFSLFNRMRTIEFCRTSVDTH